MPDKAIVARRHGVAVACLAIILGAAAPARAQNRAHIGGSASLIQVFADDREQEALLGKSWSGSVSAGVRLIKRLSLEFEPTIGGRLSAVPYSYNRRPDQPVNVTADGRDTFFTFQLRGSVGRVEPVAGVSYVRSSVHRLALFTSDSRVYFEDERSYGGFGIALGLDAPFARSRHFAIVPTFRVLTVPAEKPDVEPAPWARKAAVITRFGIGARVMF